jgi:two-component system, response regulator PdtaR
MQPTDSIVSQSIRTQSVKLSKRRLVAATGLHCQLGHRDDADTAPLSTEMSRGFNHPISLIESRAEMSESADVAGSGRAAGGAGQKVEPVKALRILVVEDDPMIGDLLAETLEDLGHTVCAVETKAANAVAAAARCHPDMMIVDVGLGEVSGIAAVKEILAAGFVRHVFVTGDVSRGLSLGPNAVLIQKPFRGPDIV